MGFNSAFKGLIYTVYKL